MKENCTWKKEYPWKLPEKREKTMWPGCMGQQEIPQRWASNSHVGTVVFAVVAHWLKIRLTCWKGSLSCWIENGFRRGEHGTGSQWKPGDPGRGYPCSWISESPVVPLGNTEKGSCSRCVCKCGGVEGNIKNYPQFHYVVGWWAIHWEEKIGVRTGMERSFKNSVGSGFIWDSYETSKNRCQMKMLDIQISNSEKDFQMEINIWGF